MKCTFCKKIGTKVVNSRFLEDSSVIKRRRQCDHCNKRFTTQELIIKKVKKPKSQKPVRKKHTKKFNKKKELPKDIYDKLKLDHDSPYLQGDEYTNEDLLK